MLFIIGLAASTPTRRGPLSSNVRPHVKLRAGVATDSDDIAPLIASFQHEITKHPDGVGAEEYLASVSEQAEREYLESSRYAFIVAEDGDGLVGFIALRDVTHVFHMFVAREHQRKGVARLLWNKAMSQALVHSSAGTFTVNSSVGAAPVYRAFGFKATAEVRSVHGISFLPMQLTVGRE